MSNTYNLVFKVLVLGDSGTGKTAILKQYIDQTFNVSYMTTIGIDYVSKLEKINGKVIKLAIWDTAGQERFRSITKLYVRGVQCILFVYDITDLPSFLNIERWIEMVRDHSNNHMQYFIIGNKSDLSSRRVVSIEKAEELAEKYKCTYYEVTATNNPSISNMFRDIARSLSADALEFIPEEIVPKITVKTDKSKRCCM